MSEPIWTVEQRPYSEVHYLLHKGTRVASFRREAWAAEAMHALNRNQAAQQQQARIEALEAEVKQARFGRDDGARRYVLLEASLTAERERAEELTRKLDVELLRRDTERPIWEQQLQAEREHLHNSHVAMAKLTDELTDEREKAARYREALVGAVARHTLGSGRCTGCGLFHCEPDCEVGSWRAALTADGTAPKARSKDSI